ncbi:hypothetical protein ACC722_39485, partial [Rhizobium ruizarguesonis]
PKPPHEAPVLLWLGPAVLAVLCLLAAIFSTFTHTFLSSPIASAILQTPVDIDISLTPIPSSTVRAESAKGRPICGV